MLTLKAVQIRYLQMFNNSIIEKRIFCARIIEFLLINAFQNVLEQFAPEIKTMFYILQTKCIENAINCNIDCLTHKLKLIE